MMYLQTDSGRRLVTLGLLGAALLSAGYWAQALRSQGTTKPLAPVQASAPVVAGDAADLSRLLGASAAEAGAGPGPAERFKVTGVIASASGQGTALIAVDGKPARPFSVGASIAAGFVLKSVSQQQVVLTDRPNGATSATLALPDPASPKADRPENVGNLGSAGTAESGQPAPNAAATTSPGVSPGVAPTPAPAEVSGAASLATPPAGSASPDGGPTYAGPRRGEQP